MQKFRKLFESSSPSSPSNRTVSSRASSPGVLEVPSTTERVATGQPSGSGGNSSIGGGMFGGLGVGAGGVGTNFGGGGGGGGDGDNSMPVRMQTQESELLLNRQLPGVRASFSSSDRSGHDDDIHTQVTRGSVATMGDLDGLNIGDVNVGFLAANSNGDEQLGSFSRYISNIELTNLAAGQPIELAPRGESFEDMGRMQSHGNTTDVERSGGGPETTMSEPMPKGVDFFLPRGDDEDNASGAAKMMESAKRMESIKTKGGVVMVTSPKVSENQTTLRFNQLDFFHFFPDGSYELRRLPRNQILEEARDSSVFQLQNRSEIKKLLYSGGKSEDDPEVRTILQGLGISGTKGMKKALRMFLKNDLQARDIRQVDPAFSAKPALWARHSAIVVSLEGIRALICYNKMFLFDPENPKVAKAAKIISHRLKTDPNVDDVFMPFEFKALEGILIASIMQLEREFALLEPEFHDALRQNLEGNRHTNKVMEQLRSNKQRLNYFQRQASGIQNALSAMLDEDEDMSHMYLTEKYNNRNARRNPLDHDEIEMLLESYLQVIDDISNRAELLDEAIDDMEDLVGLHLDTLRNRLIVFDLVTELVTLCIGFSSLFTSMFGMNIAIPPFESPNGRWWFVALVIWVFGTTFGGTMFLVYLLRRQGLSFD